MLKRSTTLLFLSAIIILAVGIFLLEKQVSQLEKDIASYGKAIEKNGDSVKILRAEWGYLTTPARLQKLADNHLDLQVMQSAQVYDIEAIPLRNRGLASYHRPGTIRAAWVASQR